MGIKVYDETTTAKVIQLYQSGVSPQQIAQELCVPDRSVIAKLSSLGVYQKKSYLNKRGEVPVKKSQHIEDLAVLLEVPVERLESLEKCNKGVLVLIIDALKSREAG